MSQHMNIAPDYIYDILVPMNFAVIHIDHISSVHRCSFRKGFNISESVNRHEM